MLFVVTGLDKPDFLAHRLKFRAQHRAHYEGLGADLILSGPFLDPKGEPIGSMIVMRRSNQADAEDFGRRDPYVTEGVFAECTVRRWSWFMNRPSGAFED